MKGAYGEGCSARAVRDMHSCILSTSKQSSIPASPSWAAHCCRPFSSISRQNSDQWRSGMFFSLRILDVVFVDVSQTETATPGAQNAFSRRDVNVQIADLCHRFGRQFVSVFVEFVFRTTSSD
uniref:Uncharacterized protein n=1 Tax=Romanomermis culicivorax TaxID=13658 RepID=A0A915L211_ROMCU